MQKLTYFISFFMHILAQESQRHPNILYTVIMTWLYLCSFNADKLFFHVLLEPVAFNKN